MLLLLIISLSPFTFTGVASSQRDFLSSRKFKCYSCTSVNATQIVGGAGVDPGVFLSTIKLGDIPITTRCRDDFNPDLAIRAGADTPFCADGLCVKINYTDKLTAAQRCYSCTTLDADKLLSEVKDENWRRWLTNVKFVPRTDQCADPFLPENALREGTKSQPCEEGICMKMWFKERQGGEHVWRSCIANARSTIREDCTRISSGEGDMEVCTCAGHLCNTATPPLALLASTSLFSAILAAYSFLFISKL